MSHLTRVSLGHPRLALLVLVLISVVLGAGLTRLRTEFGYRVLVGHDHPTIRNLEAFIAQFGGGLPVWVAWECGPQRPCATVFDASSLEMAHHLTQAMLPLAATRRVEGPANAPVLVPDPSGFAIRRFVENGELAPDAAALARHALADPQWTGNLVSPDASVGALVVQPADTRNDTAEQIFDALAGALAPYEQRGFTFYLIGDPVSTVAAGRDLAKSMSRTIPFTVLSIGLVLWWLTRSMRAVAIALATMGLALGWTFGLLGWLDWPRDGILEALAPLLLIVGVCDAVHLLSRYGVEVAARRGLSREDRTIALLAAVRDVGGPCAITTLTTCGAFLSFLTSPLDSFVRFGAIAAFGVAVCLVLSLSLLPLLVVRVPAAAVSGPGSDAAWRSALERIARIGQRRSLAILGIAAVVLGASAVGWFGHLRVDTDWDESFGAGSRVVRWRSFVEDRLRHSTTLEVKIELPREAPLAAPGTLQRIEALSTFLSRLDGMGSSTSVLDLLARLNRLLHDDDPLFERPGATRAANSELLELLSFDDPEILARWISLDRSALRISIDAPEQSQQTRAKILAAVREYVERELPASWDVDLAGSLAVGFDWVRDVQETQVRSFPVAFALVFVMTAVFFGSLRLAAAAMIPALMPVVVTLGAMGWAGMSLDVGRAMVAAIVLGIAVDDSVHLLSHYRRRRRSGERRDEAIGAAVLHTGRPVVTTSLALSLGFLTLTASAWQTIASFGFAVALAILVALAAVLFVLPALLSTAHGTDGARCLSAPPPGGVRLAAPWPTPNGGSSRSSSPTSSATPRWSERTSTGASRRARSTGA